MDSHRSRDVEWKFEIFPFACSGAAYSIRVHDQTRFSFRGDTKHLEVYLDRVKRVCNLKKRIADASCRNEMNRWTGDQHEPDILHSIISPVQHSPTFASERVDLPSKPVTWPFSRVETDPVDSSLFLLFL